MFLLIVAFVFFTYATGKHGMGWRWLGVALPIVIVAMMLVRAWRLGSRDGARLKELERLKQDWQERAEHGEIPHTGSKPRAPRRDRRGRVTCAAADQERP